MMNCDYCGATIGVYEPAVIVSEGETIETSEAAKPELTANASERYHFACYRERSASAA